MRGDFECPKCRAPLRIGQPRHTCDPWLMMGLGLDLYRRNLAAWHMIMGYGPKEIYGP